MTATEGCRATILLVDDDPAFATLLTERLGAEGYIVEHAENAAAATKLTERISPDLILLDLGLPDRHGLVLCAELKDKPSPPIIICSGTKHEHEAVLGLKLGADDFVAKPISIDELSARIEVVLRRSSAQTAMESSQQIDRIGNLMIDKLRYAVVVGDQQLKLTPTEFRLLCALASRPGQVLSRHEIVDMIWGYNDVAVSRSLDVHVRRLRGKLEACVPTAPRILTVRGFGYKIAEDSGSSALSAVAS
jgi:DNA-binding response OmpR family regulator